MVRLTTEIETPPARTALTEVEVAPDSRFLSLTPEAVLVAGAAAEGPSFACSFGAFGVAVAGDGGMAVSQSGLGGVSVAIGSGQAIGGANGVAVSVGPMDRIGSGLASGGDGAVAVAGGAGRASTGNGGIAVVRAGGLVLGGYGSLLLIDTGRPGRDRYIIGMTECPRQEGGDGAPTPGGLARLRANTWYRLGSRNQFEEVPAPPDLAGGPPYAAAPGEGCAR